MAEGPSRVSNVPCAVQKRLFRAVPSPHAAGLAGFWAHPPPSGSTEGVPCTQPPGRQHQVGEAKQGDDVRGVPGQAPVAGLAVPEQVLDDVERVLDLRPQAGLDALDAPFEVTDLIVGQRPARARIERGQTRLISPD